MVGRILAETKPRFVGENPDVMMQALEDSVSWDSCAAVSQGLVNFGTSATEPLLTLLHRGDKEIYRSAANALAQIAKVDPSIMPDVIKAMNDENWNVRSGAFRVLFDSEPPLPLEGIPPLIRSLNEEDRHRHTHVVSTLERFGSAAIPALLESLRSRDWRVRAGSAEALGLIENDRQLRRDSEPPQSEPAIPAFLQIMRERNPLRFRAATLSMSWIRQCSEPGLENELIDALADSDAGIRASAADLLGRIDLGSTSAAVPALLEKLNDEAEEVRFEAAVALARIAPEVSAAGVPILHAVLAHGGDWTYMKDPIRPSERRRGAVYALTRHGAAAAEAVPALIDALGEYCLAETAADTLGHLGPLASAAVPALLHLLENSDEDIRNEAARALAAIGPDAASAAVTKLMGRLRETGEVKRGSAADCLSEIGLPAAEVAIPALMELMSDPSKYIRYHAAGALKELGCDVPDPD